MLQRAARVHSDKPFHMRRVEGVFRSFTYAQVFDEIFAAAQRLHGLGVRRGHHVAILAETSPEWSIADWACQTLGAVTVPIYPTLPADQVQHIFSDSKSNLALVQDAKQAAKLPEEYTATLDDALYGPEPKDALTRDEWEEDISETKRSDIATIIYTSGTTSVPKGVMLRHGSFIALISGVVQRLPVDHTDRFLSFLPLSHVFARFADHALVAGVGATVAFSGGIASLARDMADAKPTIMICVPRFLEATKSRIVDTMRKKGGMTLAMFNLALSQGEAKRRGKFAPLAGLMDSLVASKIREKTGGRIRYFAAGGAALAPDVAEFYRAMGLDVLQGYGLTETCAATCLNLPEQNNPETVGPPIPGVELKIAKDGEILIRGESVMEGYWQMPKATAEAIDKDGWFHSGDIGVMEGGRLKITDRKKDILVLGNGKNVAPQPIENLVKRHPAVAETVVFGDGSPYCYALIIPDFDYVRTEVGVGGSDEEISAHDDCTRLISEAVKRANRELADYQKVKKHAIVPRAFTQESGELTPSLKVKRRVVGETCADLLAGIAPGD